MMNPTSVRETARLAYRLGLRVIPPREDGTKRPLSAWKQFQTEPPSKEQMRSWYANGHEPHGIGLIMGNGIECLEFEDRGMYQTYRDTAEAGGLGDLIDRIEAGYMETTPGGGIHWLYYCEETSGNTKLASRPAEGQQRPHWPQNVDVLIETRGDGGYIIIAPSHGPVHESGRAYELVSGGLEQIATITPDERQELFLLARAFDESPKPDYQPAHTEPTPIDGTRPGDDYISRTDWKDLLEPHGWRLVYQHGETQYWRRPGKNIGISATINGEGVTPDRLYVFTSSTDFEPNRSYTRFQFYAVTEHQGDFHAAAKELAAQGYGDQRTGDIRLMLGTSASNGTHDESNAESPGEPRFRIYNAQEIKDREPPPQLIRGVMIDRSHAALFGNPGSFKSFIALDMASRIASGGLWCGYPVEQGATLYTTGEGQASFGNRVKAWEIAREETNHTWVLPEAVQYPKLAEVDDLLKAIDYYLTEQPRLIVIDTLARSSIGLDENSAEDMSNFIAGVDRVIREFGCSVLTVHHANRQGFYRGSSSLLGAWDTVMETKKDDSGLVTVSCVKQKDLSEFAPINLRPEPVTLKEGSGLMPPLTSIVMQEESSGILTTAARTALEILNTFPDGTYNQPWEEAVVACGISRSHFFRCKKQLMEFGLIETRAGVYFASGKDTK
jgi:hypothetical protein